jgi:hypothetical protein
VCNPGWLKVDGVAGHHLHTVDKRRRGDQTVPHGPRVRHMKTGAPQGHLDVDGQNSAFKRRWHMAAEPSAEQPSLSCIPAVGQ